MNWEKIITKSVEGASIYLIYKVASMAVAEGTASEPQKQLISSYNTLVAENENKFLLRQMRAEAAIIEEKQRLFDKKWGTSKLISKHHHDDVVDET